MSPIFVIGQTVIWQEDFSSYADGTTTASDNNPPSGVDWTRDISGSSNIPPGYFEVQSQAFSSFNTQGEVVWQTESITLDPAKRYYLNVDISYLLTSGNDYIRVYYQIDGGTEVLFGEFQAFSFLGGSQTFNVYALSGSSLSIRCEVFTQTDFFGLLTAVINFDNVTVTEHRQLYSISDGNWNSPGRWSVTRGGPSCACIPVPNDIVFITNSYTININNANMQVSGVRIENGGLLRWTGTGDVDLIRDDIIIDSGGSMDRNGNTADVLLSGSADYTITNNGTVNISNLNLNADNIILEITGNSGINLTNDLDFQPNNTGIVVTNNNTASLTLNRIFFDDDNCSLINNGTIVVNDAIEVVGSGDDNNSVTNYGTISVAADIDASDGDFYVYNYGTFSNNGFNAIPNTTNGFYNYNNGSWTYGGANFDASVRLFCDNGNNNFTYNRSGIQNIITPQDAYSNLTFSGSGAKTMLGSFTVRGDITAAGIATLSAGTNTVTLGGTAQQDLTGNLAFGGLLIVNNSAAANAVVINDAATVSRTLTLTDGIVSTASGTLTLAGATASVSGGSDASFVDGPMSYTGVTTGTKVFPVGKIDQIHRADLNVTGPSAVYTAEYITSSASALGYTLPGSITHVSNVGYWTISNGGTGVTSAFVTLYYNIDDEVTDENFLRIAKDDGSGNWIDLGGTGSAPFAGNITSTNNFTSFSVFALANGLGGANPLPVEWLSFTGQQREDRILLTWKTAAEKDNDYFTVERSANGIEFAELGEIPGSGTTYQISTYQFTDEQPFIGIGYYRIRQTDYDEKTDFSRIIAVDFDPFKDPARKNADLLIYPNPIIGESVRLVVNNRYNIQEMEISIVDASGRIWLVQPILLSDNILDLNLERSRMAPGLYTIRLTSPAAVYSAKMVVQ